MLDKLKSLGMSTAHFIAGTYAYTAHYTRSLTSLIMDAGKREMCREPLHNHHDGCPECDMPQSAPDDVFSGNPDFQEY